MKFAHAFLTLSLIVVFGCMSRPAPQIAKEGNTRLELAEKQAQDLKQNESIDVKDDAKTKTFEKSTVPANKLASVRTKLKTYIDNVTELLRIAAEKKVTIDSNLEWLKKSLANAQSILNSLKD